MSTSTREASANAGASRASKNGHFKIIKFRGLKLKLPGTTKLRLLKQMTTGTNEEMIEAVEALLGPEQMAEVWNLDVDISKGLEELGVMLGDLSLAVFDAYGSSAGESQASPRRSKATGARSRRTSSTTTDST
jgi:hypothetical protein